MDPENPLAKVAQPFATDQNQPQQDSSGSALGALNAANAAPSHARTAAEATNLGWEKYHKAPDVVSDDAYQKNKEVFDFLNPNEARPLASSVTPEKPKATAPIIRTFKADVAEAVETKHISSVDVALAEQRRGSSKAIDLSTDDAPKRNWMPVIVMIVAGVLVVAALAYGVKLYLDGLKKSETPIENTVVVTLPKAVILTETQREIPAEALPAGREKETLRMEVVDSRITLNTMSYLYLTARQGEGKQLVSTALFADLLNLSMPSQLTRSLLPTYTFGVHAFNGNQPFLIFENSFYENAYSGMLAWEKTMENDFAGFFFAKETSPITATSSAAVLGARGTWIDEVIRNKDVRTLKSPTGKTLLMYSLPDKNTIVITTNEFTLREIFERLTTAKITR